MEEIFEKPKVSIIIPTYNSDGTLEKCLKSVYNQSYRFYDVIVVDNFSNDLTIKIAKKFGAKIIQRKCNPALARNIGVTNSTSKYILFIDSDQILSPSIIEECIGECEEKNVGMVRIPEVFIGKNFWSSCSATWKNCYLKAEKQYGSSENIMSGSPRFFVKDYIINAGMLNSSLLWGEDYDFYKRMEKIGIKETSCKSELYHYEPLSLRGILFKLFRYGKSMPIFTSNASTRTQIFQFMLINSLWTLKEILKEYKRFPAMIAGCTFLLWLKAYSLAMGLLVSWGSNKRSE